MELLFSYAITHGCFVAACWLLTHADYHTLPPPTRYLGSNPIPKKQTFGVQMQIWF